MPDIFKTFAYSEPKPVSYSLMYQLFFTTTNLMGAWVIHPPARRPHIQPSAPGPIKVLTSSTFSYLNSSHYDHVHITFNDLRVN